LEGQEQARKSRECWSLLNELSQGIGLSPAEILAGKKLEIDSDRQDEYIKEKIQSSEDIKE
jgi:hypothetical protein